MNNDECLAVFEHTGIRPTAIRILVYKAVSELRDTFSLMDAERALPTVDKSTLFRTLTLLHEHHLLHTVDDGSGQAKYCLCSNHGSCTEEECHCHFFCLSCHKTFCLYDTPVPQVTLPDGFEEQRVNYIVKGICPDCKRKRKV